MTKLENRRPVLPLLGKLSSASVALAFAVALVGGCGSSTSASGYLGSYAIMITAMSVSDSAVVTINPGHDDTILFYFDAGITTDVTGPNPNGLIATLNGTTVTLMRQPAHIDHSTGPVDGFLTGDGMLAPDGSMLSLTLHFQAGSDPSAPTTDYAITGAKM